MSRTEALPSNGAHPQAREEHIHSIVQQFRVVFRSIQDHSRWVERRCGVSAAQLWAMSELLATPGMRVSELSRALSIHQSTASNMLDKLEKKGLVARERKSADQRVVRLYLTEEGAALVAAAPKPAQGALTSALYALTDISLAQLDAGMVELVESMQIKDLEAALEPLSESGKGKSNNEQPHAAG